MLGILLLPVFATCVPLRVMTFNIWSAPDWIEDAVRKVAKHIKLVNPDVVTLQEVRNQVIFDELLRELGTEWNGLYNHKDPSYSDVAVVSRHQINNNTLIAFGKAIGVQISLPSGKSFHIWSAHFEGTDYGPDGVKDGLVTTQEQLMSRENPSGKIGRYQQVVEIKEHPDVKTMMKDSCASGPVIFTGDFNSPSHLDWIESTKHLHYNLTFEWPVTKILADMGFKDSYRKLHPDPLITPGNTWSTVYRDKKGGSYFPVPIDRIDFILYKGKAKPVYSDTYYGTETLSPMPNQMNNDFPSDHYALVTDFELF